MADPVTRAVDALTQPEAARDEAHEQLEQALEDVGWRRMGNPDEALYYRTGHGGFAVPLARALDELKRAAA